MPRAFLGRTPAKTSVLSRARGTPVGRAAAMRRVLTPCLNCSWDGIPSVWTGMATAPLGLGDGPRTSLFTPSEEFCRDLMAPDFMSHTTWDSAGHTLDLTAW